MRQSEGPASKPVSSGPYKPPSYPRSDESTSLHPDLPSYATRPKPRATSTLINLQNRDRQTHTYSKDQTKIRPPTKRPLVYIPTPARMLRGLPSQALGAATRPLARCAGCPSRHSEQPHAAPLTRCGCPSHSAPKPNRLALSGPSLAPARRGRAVGAAGAPRRPGASPRCPFSPGIPRRPRRRGRALPAFPLRGSLPAAGVAPLGLGSPPRARLRRRRRAGSAPPGVRSGRSVRPACSRLPCRSNHAPRLIRRVHIHNHAHRSPQGARSTRLREGWGRLPHTPRRSAPGTATGGGSNEEQDKPTQQNRARNLAHARGPTEWPENLLARIAAMQRSYSGSGKAAPHSFAGRSAGGRSPAGPLFPVLFFLCDPQRGSGATSGQRGPRTLWRCPHTSADI